MLNKSYLDKPLTASQVNALESDPLSLHLDQATPQKVINGTPQFDVGIKIKENQWVYLDGV